MSEDGTTQRRLTRSAESRVIAGVAGGLGEYTGLDPVIFRIGFVALAVAGGSGLLMYFLAWLVIPTDGETGSPGEGFVARIKRSRWVPIVFIGVAVLILIETLGTWGGPALWAIALIAIGIALLQDDVEPVPSRPVTASHETAERTTVDAPAPAVRVRRRRSPLGAYTLGAALLVVALAVALSGTGALDLDLAQFVALGVLTLGAGLIVGAWWGRARLLILLGLVVIPFMMAASAVSVPFEGFVGDRYVQGEDISLEDHYELLAGTLTLDLAEYDFSDEPTEIDIGFFTGNVDVWVPPGVEVTTDVTMDAGVLDVFGDSREGADLYLETTHQRPGLTEGELIIHARGGFGSFDASWANWIEDEKQRALDRKEEKTDADGRKPRRDGKRD